jgi:hypothetical protein
VPLNAIETAYHEALRLYVCTLTIGNRRARGLGDTPEDALVAAAANARAAVRVHLAGATISQFDGIDPVPVE